MLLGGCPAFVSWAAKNIEKHPACAAPISSSGFVPVDAPSNLETNVNGASKNPVPPFIVPAPSLSVPVHVACAFETAMWKVVLSKGYARCDSVILPRSGHRATVSKAQPALRDAIDGPHTEQEHP